MNQRVLPPLNWLRAFEAAARHMSFTLAADEIGITQSAVSQQIKALEGRLKLDLFIRRPRSLSLSDAGRDYLPFVQRAFETLEEGTRPYLTRDSAKTLTIYVNSAFSVLWLMPRLSGFTERYPDIRLDVLASFWNADLAGATADVEIRYGSRDFVQDSAVELHPDRLYPVCSPSFAEKLRELEDLHRVPRLWVRHVADTWEYWAKSANVGAFAEPGQHQFNSYILKYGYAARSGGVALGHDTLCAGYLASGELIRPLDITVETRERYYLITPDDQSISDAANVFRDWLLAEFADFAV